MISKFRRMNLTLFCKLSKSKPVALYFNPVRFHPVMNSDLFPSGLESC